MVVDADDRPVGVMQASSAKRRRRGTPSRTHRFAGCAIACRGWFRAGIAHLAVSELGTGLLLGAVLGLLAYLPVRLAFGCPGRSRAPGATRRSAVARSPR